LVGHISDGWRCIHIKLFKAKMSGLQLIRRGDGAFLASYLLAFDVFIQFFDTGKESLKVFFRSLQTIHTTYTKAALH